MGSNVDLLQQTTAIFSAQEYWGLGKNASRLFEVLAASPGGSPAALSSVAVEPI